MTNSRYLIIAFTLTLAIPALAKVPNWWPVPHAGNWQSTMQVRGRSFSSESCLTERDIQKAKNEDEAALGGENCTPGTYSRQGDNVFVANYSCKNASYTVKQTQLNKDHYQVETTTLDRKQGPIVMQVDMKYLGSCKATDSESSSDNPQMDMQKALQQLKKFAPT
ncbi:MAG: DUF3617 family protein [Candidatus Methylopumilus sp.]|jgi:hypothetical protein